MTDIPIMTETEESGQFYEGGPIPVHLASQDASLTRADAADKASYNTYSLSETQPGPIQILPRSPNRHRAIVYISVTGSSVLLNKDRDSLQASIPVGAYINNGTSFTLENTEPLYAVWNAGSPNITVIEERWLTTPREGE